jgi:hypothetical protein
MIIAFQVKEYNPPPPQPIKIFVKTEILFDNITNFAN